jgi:hypothetical protein
MIPDVRMRSSREGVFHNIYMFGLSSPPQLKDFRLANEERYTHRYQSPYYLHDQDSDHSVAPRNSSPMVANLPAGAKTKTLTLPAETGSSHGNSSISLLSQNV